MKHGKRCSHVYRSGQLHSSIKIGSVAVGQCENECFPDLVVCFEHATKDTLALLARTYMDRCKQLEREMQKPKHGTKVLVYDDWLQRRSTLPDEKLCPCDNHPPEKCETCRGACSCHFAK